MVSPANSFRSTFLLPQVSSSSFQRWPSIHWHIERLILRTSSVLFTSLQTELSLNTLLSFLKAYVAILKRLSMSYPHYSFKILHRYLNCTCLSLASLICNLHVRLSILLATMHSVFCTWCLALSCRFSLLIPIGFIVVSFPYLLNYDAICNNNLRTILKACF